MIRQGGGDGSLDLAAVARDDALLDGLGNRSALPDDIADPTSRLLQGLTREVDDGLTELLATLPRLPRELPATPHAGVPSLADRRRRRAVRGTVLAAVLAGTLSLGGVSAAVTGDPFAAYRSVVGVLAPHDDLPPNAAQVAHLNRMVTDARALARAGDPSAAAALEELRTAVAGATDLPPGQRTVLERKIAALEASLAGDTTSRPKPVKPKAQTKPEKPTDPATGSSSRERAGTGSGGQGEGRGAQGSRRGGAHSDTAGGGKQDPAPGKRWRADAGEEPGTDGSARR